MYGIVKQLDGFIWVESELGQGSTFEVYLPVAVDKAVPEPVSPATTMRPPDGRRETILLVEDEHTVRRFARLALERHGFVVIESATPEEALALAPQQTNSRCLCCSQTLSCPVSTDESWPID